MDFWNRRKVEMLQTELSACKQRESNLQTEVERLSAVVRGDRVCDGYCERCKHGIKIDGYQNIGGFIIPSPYKCELDCKCKDFEKR